MSAGRESLRASAKTVPFVLALGLAPGAAWAERVEEKIERGLERMAATRGADYLGARDGIVTLGGDARRVLEVRVKGLSFSRATWREDVLVEIALAHLTEPELARRVLTLEGLAPAKYLTRRRPEPEVGRELERMTKGAPLLFELLMKTAEVYPFAPRASYPARLSDAEVRALRDKEELALETGAVGALAALGHPAAAYLLEELARSEAPATTARPGVRPEVKPEVRRAAASGLGTTRAPGAETALLAIARDTKASVVVRGGAIAGLGQLRTRTALDALEAVYTRAEDAELQRAVVAAIGSLGGAAALERPAHGARKSAAALDLRERAATWLVDTLASRRGADDETALVEALSMTRDRPTLKRLGQRLSDGADPEDVRARLTRARTRLARAISRE